MTIRDAYDYERCSDHYTSEKAVVTITFGNYTVPLCKTCLAAFWRGVAARIDAVAELAAKINEKKELAAKINEKKEPSR